MIIYKKEKTEHGEKATRCGFFTNCFLTLKYYYVKNQLKILTGIAIVFALGVLFFTVKLLLK